MGPVLIRELTGYDDSFVEKNINVPEFKRELKDRIKNNLEKLKDEGLLNKQGFITDEGFELSTLSMLSEELDKLEGQGYFGEKQSKKRSQYGERQDYRAFERHDKYKDISIKQTAKHAIRRGRKKITSEDLIVADRLARGKVEIVYAVDASGSMKGEKIKVAKKAGIALAYSTIKNNDEAGLVVFESKTILEKEPSKNFFELALDLNKIKTKGETDIGLSIEKATQLFKHSKKTKHIVILTDALQTTRNKSEKDVIEKVNIAINQGITISMIGINMNKQGEELAKKIVDLTNGTLYKVKNIEEIDQIILEDYYRVRAH